MTLWEASYPPGLHWEVAAPQGTLADLVTESARQYGDVTFLEYRCHCISFAAFAQTVEAVAAGLLRLGLQPGERVALYLPNSPYHPFSFFGVIKAGGVVAHLSPLDAERELVHKLRDSGARFLITTNIGPMLAAAQKLRGLVEHVIVGDDAAFGAMESFQVAVPDDVINFDDLLTAPTQAHWPVLEREALTVLQYTGGTTGLPKAAIHTHATLLAGVASYQQFYTQQTDEPAPQERVITVLPFFHIYGLVVLLLWQLRRGATLLLHLRFDPQAVLHDIEVGRATYFPGVPTMWIALAAIPGVETRDFSSLRQISSGGAPLPPDVAQRVKALCGRRIGGGWGMTETAAAGTSHLMKGRFEAGSVGIPLPGVEIRIVDLQAPGRILGTGEKGEIAVRGPNIFKGYYRKDSTAEFVDGFFLTGDIGYLDEHGLMYIVDRKKDMIISGGFNVYPTQIESAIYEHPDVEECIVIGISDNYRGQAAKAFVKLRDGAAEFSLETLRAFLADKIGRYELPAALEFRDTLPKTPVGKLSRKELVAETLLVGA
jgi:long-chain acyl-CoA synthetase